MTEAIRWAVVGCIVLLLSAFHMPVMADDAATNTRVHFDIPRQRADLALTKFAEQADLTLVFPYDQVREKTANQVVGEYTLEEAIALLLADTGLAPTFKNQLVLNIAIDEEATSKGGIVKLEKRTGLLALLAGIFAGGVAAAEGGPSATDDQAVTTNQALEEIIVTGTHIRGLGQSSSPVISIDRTEISESGFGSVAELVASITQNYAFGATEDGASNPWVSAAAGDISNSTAINLRGLGVDSTLVLINGRRTVAGGRFGAIVDVSTIPLAAIERVEILTDGASAIYGADAIGGVVNFILRDEYEGAETRLRYGSVTEGDRDDIQFGQVFGWHGNAGNLLLSYDYASSGALASADRAYAADSDLSRFGGDQFSGFSQNNSNPGNIIAGITTYAIPAGQDGTMLTSDDFVANTVNISNVREGTHILPEQERHSLFVSGSYQFSPQLGLFADLRYSKRDSERRRTPNVNTLTVTDVNPFFVDPTGTGLTSVRVSYSFIDDLGNMLAESRVENGGATIGMTLGLSKRWQAEIYASYAEETGELTNSNFAADVLLEEALGNFDDPATPEFDVDNPATDYNPLEDGFLNLFADGSNTNPEVIAAIGTPGFNVFERNSDILVVNGKIDGDLFEIPGGPVQFAAGVEYREESLSSWFLDASNGLDATLEPGVTLSRDIGAAFAELSIPIFSNLNSAPGLRRLELSIATRHEDYSDFGSSTNPKYGVLWSPVSGLIVRGTYGTSFKAPLLTELDDTDLATNTFLYFDVSFLGLPPAIFLGGNNSELKAEEATTWTAGLQIAPPQLQGLSFEATLFDIEFENRITGPLTGSLFEPFFDPERFAAVLNLNPTLEQIAEIVNDPRFDNTLGTASDPADLASGLLPVEAILDARLNNVANTVVSGVDFALSYQFARGINTFGLKIGGTYLAEFKDALLPTDPLVELVDTVNNPVNLRMRNSFSWNREHFGLTAFVNYVDDYRDDQSDPERSIDSWTTIDLQLRYDTGEAFARSWLSQTVFSLSVLNLFDEDPPFVNNLGVAVGYDPNNADPLGRFVALEFTKQW